MDYLRRKQVHIACAVLSIAGFAARGVLMLRESHRLQAIVSVALTRARWGYFRPLLSA